MLIAGWGGKEKPVGFLGIEKCDNCKNYGFFNLFEISKKISLFFVPVANYSKKYYAVCEICKAGYELDDEGYKKMLAESTKIPDRDTIADIWNDIDARVLKEFGGKKSSATSMEKTLEKIKKEISHEWGDKVTKDNINYVFGKYLLNSLGQIEE